MGSIRPPEPVLPFWAVISRHGAAVFEAIEAIAQRWGPVGFCSEPLPFEAGGYYAEAMGCDLRKTLVALEEPVDPAELVAWKLWSNAWEAEVAGNGSWPETRPVNLDPGYVSQAKLVLATTKDRDHRLYLRQGIYAEITLSFVGGRWTPHRRTYPDYQSPDVFAFLGRCRQHLRGYLARHGSWRTGGGDSRRV